MVKSKRKWMFYLIFITTMIISGIFVVYFNHRNSLIKYNNQHLPIKMRDFIINNKNDILKIELFSLGGKKYFRIFMKLPKDIVSTFIPPSGGDCYIFNEDQQYVTRTSNIGENRNFAKTWLSSKVEKEYFIQDVIDSSIVEETPENPGSL